MADAAAHAANHGAHVGMRPEEERRDDALPIDEGDDHEDLQEQEGEVEALRAIYFDGEFSGAVPSFDLFITVQLDEPLRVRIAGSSPVANRASAVHVG